MTASIVSDHLGNSPGERDAHDKDCNLTLKVVRPRLDEASLSPGSSSYVKGMHLEGMLVSCIEELKELFADSTLHKQSSLRPARMIFSLPIYTTTNCLQSNGYEDVNFGGPRAGEQDPDLPSASLETIHEETVDTELEDDQYIVERLLGKRVHRIRRRKVVQYFVKWKGYAEEENTWVDKANIHKDLVKEYESVSISGC